MRLARSRFSRLFSQMGFVGLLLIVLLHHPGLSFAQPTPFEIDQITKEVHLAFSDFLQMWKEEQYFEVYQWGKKQSQDQITQEEFSLRMVQLPYTPAGLVEEEKLDISFRFRTLIYVTATIEFRHKSNSSIKFKKRQPFLMLWEDKKWRFDLLQMLRSPYYISNE